MSEHHRKLSQAADAYLRMAERLKKQMLETRVAVDRASDQRIRLELLRSDAEIGNEAADLLEEAKRLHHAAYQAHLTALRRYHDFVTQGALSERHHGKPS